MTPFKPSNKPLCRTVCVLGYRARLWYDGDGYWITDKQGYRNTILFAQMRITSPEGETARRFVLWRFMVEWTKLPREAV